MVRIFHPTMGFASKRVLKNVATLCILSIMTDNKTLYPLLSSPSEYLDDALPPAYSRTTNVTIMPKNRKDRNVRQGPNSYGYLDTIQSSFTVCQNLLPKTNYKG